MNVVLSAGLEGRRNRRKSGLESPPGVYRTTLKKLNNFGLGSGYSRGIQYLAPYPIRI
jgi:hypothetical protein